MVAIALSVLFILLIMALIALIAVKVENRFHGERLPDE